MYPWEEHKFENQNFIRLFVTSFWIQNAALEGFNINDENKMLQSGAGFSSLRVATHHSLTLWTKDKHWCGNYKLHLNLLHKNYICQFLSLSTRLGQYELLRLSSENLWLLILTHEQTQRNMDTFASCPCQTCVGVYTYPTLAFQLSNYWT